MGLALDLFFDLASIEKEENFNAIMHCRNHGVHAVLVSRIRGTHEYLSFLRRFLKGFPKFRKKFTIVHRESASVVI